MFRKREPPPPPPPPPQPSPARRFTDAAAAGTTAIGPGTRIRGDITGDDAVDLAGTLEGDSRVGGPYRVREGARVVGTIEAASAVVEGEVTGSVRAAAKVEIGARARVRANVSAAVVAIAEGAFVDGQILTEGGGQSGPQAFKEKRRGALPPGAKPPTA